MSDGKHFLNDLDDVSELMHCSLPAGMKLGEFGKLVGWGRRSAEARNRIMTISRADIDLIGLTLEQAQNWVAAYEAVVRLTPQNPSAAGRLELMQHVVRLLKGN